jgi:hypothetical protein
VDPATSKPAVPTNSESSVKDSSTEKASAPVSSCARFFVIPTRYTFSLLALREEGREGGRD